MQKDSKAFPTTLLSRGPSGLREDKDIEPTKGKYCPIHGRVHTASAEAVRCSINTSPDPIEVPRASRKVGSMATRPSHSEVINLDENPEDEKGFMTKVSLSGQKELKEICAQNPFAETQPKGPNLPQSKMWMGRKSLSAVFNPPKHEGKPHATFILSQIIVE